MFWPSLLMPSLAFAVVQSMQQCRSTHSKRGHYLKDHVISSENVENIGVCYIKCSKDRRCKSINFHIDNLFCELNDADRFTHPWDYVLKKDHAYAYCPGKVSFRTYVMPPSWLKTHASYINSNHDITADQITFSAGPTMNAALLKVPLVGAGVLEDGAVLTVEMTVANDVSIGQVEDSDIRYGVSDGTSFIGFETVDRSNYYKSPCYGAEGKSGETLTEIQWLDRSTSLPASERFYPDQFLVTLKLDQSWGSCFTPHDGGFNKTAEYTKQVLLSHGLTLEVYKSHGRELVGIKYINITVTINDDY